MNPEDAIEAAVADACTRISELQAQAAALPPDQRLPFEHECELLSARIGHLCD